MTAIKIEFENKAALEKILSQLQNELLARSVPAIEPAEQSIEIFAKMPIEQQKQILSNIVSYIEIFAEENDKKAIGRLREVARLKNAFNRFNLRPVDDDVLNIISENEVIEVYNLKGIQLYRNMYFFKVCGYSLLDLSVCSWETLYDKPKSALEATQKAVKNLFSSDGKAIPFELPTYLQKENSRFLKSVKTVEVTPKFLAPLFNVTTGEPAGALSTYGARVIAEGDQSIRFRTLR